MDIDLLSKMISELIVDHDRVGLPGVGTFYTEVVPSTFSDRGYTINPPYRRLSFLPNAVENDLLVNFYSDVNGTPADMAREYIVQFLRELAEALKEHKTITLPGLGRLRATKENNFFFVADEDLDIYPEAFGLAPVSLKNIPGLDDDKVDIRFEFKPPVRKAEEPEPSGASAPAAEPVSGLGASAAVETAAMQEPAESSEPAEPVETAESAEPAVAAAPEASVPEPDAATPEIAGAEVFPGADATAEPAEPELHVDATAEPAVAVEPTESAALSASAATAAVAEPAKVAAPAETAAPAVPAETAASAELSETAEPSESAKPAELIEPAEPAVAAAPEASVPEPDAATPEIAGAEVFPGTDATAEPAEPELRADAAEEARAAEEDDGRTVKKFRWWIPLLVLSALAAIFLAVFLILAHVAPDFIDSILYTPEELRIINY